jgi:hypothetical protein
MVNELNFPDDLVLSFFIVIFILFIFVAAEKKLISCFSRPQADRTFSITRIYEEKKPHNCISLIVNIRFSNASEESSTRSYLVNFLRKSSQKLTITNACSQSIVRILFQNQLISGFNKGVSTPTTQNRLDMKH